MNMMRFLTEQYGLPHRSYHTILHPATMLAYAREYQQTHALTANQVAAVWFHDVADKEETSAELAQAWLATDPKINVPLVQQIILDTKDHRATCPESKAVLDLDLLVLSQPNGYGRYLQQIEEEFRYIPRSDFLRGRCQFLMDMLARPCIYNNVYCRVHQEVRAYANLRDELKARSCDMSRELRLEIFPAGLIGLLENAKKIRPYLDDESREYAP